VKRHETQPRVHRLPCLYVFLVAGAFLVIGCTDSPQVHRDSFLAMSSYVELTVVEAPPHDYDTALRRVEDEVARLESVLSDYDPDSNVGRLNRRATTQMAPETRLLLERAQRVCHETGGAFDVSLGPIKRLWGFGDDATPAVPARADIDRLLQHIGCDVYRITPEGTLHWNDPEARIDLGGIAQGLVAQRTADILRQEGFENFLINVSGDILVGGTRPDGQAWRIGVQDPRRPEGLVARLSLVRPALTTSGDYEQAFFADGQRYHHIFDPMTGFPARGCASVSVFCNDAIDADCYATAVFVLGPQKGLAFLESRPDLEGLITVETSPGSVRVLQSSGLHAELLVDTP